MIYEYDASNLPTGAIIGIGLFGLVMAIIVFVAYVKIISRAGYSGWWVLVMFVPILNVVMLLIFAYKQWPIQRELAELRGWANQIQRSNDQRGPGYGQRGPGYDQRGPGYGQRGPGPGQDPLYPRQ